MHKLLAIAVVLSLAACAAVEKLPPAPVADEGPGARIAASLGYHGPVERPRDATLYSKSGTP